MAEIFFKHNINGKALLLLKEKDLRDIGITAIGELIVINEVMKKLKSIDLNLLIFRTQNENRLALE